MSDERVYSDLIAVLVFVAIVCGLMACALGLDFCVNDREDDLEPIPAKENETEAEKHRREAYNRAIENIRRINEVMEL